MFVRPCRAFLPIARNELSWVRSFSKFELYGSAPTPDNKLKFIPKSGSYPLGFCIGSVKAGIKPESSPQPDLVLVSSDRPSNGAAVFTKNEFPAASITVSKEIIQRTRGHGIQGIIANSGCANLFTGKPGLQDATRMVQEAIKYVPNGGHQDSVLVMHTGAGGERLPLDRIHQSLPGLQQSMGNSHEHWRKGAEGLLTTDTFPKIASRPFKLPSSNREYSLAGITKGAGMIHPNMATTLGLICTDAPISPDALQQFLGTAADKSYNCISIEGDTSTNDMVAILANGAAGGTQIRFDPSASRQSEDFVAFQKILIEHMAELAKLVVRDGEGATKFVTIRVKGAPTYEIGKRVASAIAKSVLVKTGIYGNSPVWGTISAALGASLVDTVFSGQGAIVPELTSISMNTVDGGGGPIEFLHKGIPVEVDQIAVTRALEQEDLEFLVDLRDATECKDSEEAIYWTCDITHEFVTVNGNFKK